MTYRVHIATLFSAMFGLAVVLSAGTILAVSVINARMNLVENLAGEFDLTISAIEERVAVHMSAAQNQVSFLNAWIRDDPGLVTDDRRLATIMRAARAAAPQVVALALLRPDRTSVRIVNDRSDPIIDDLGARQDIWSVFLKAKALGENGGDLGWSEPLFSPNIGRTIIVYREPLWRDGRLIGLLLSAVDLIELSNFAKQLSSRLGQTVFILHDQNKVIAHPDLLQKTSKLTAQYPTLKIDALGDARLRQIWRADRKAVISQSQMKQSRGHYILSDGEWQVFIYAQSTSYGATPWLIGFHFDTSQRGQQVRQFWLFLALGLVLLAIFMAMGVLIGGRLAQPIERLTDVAGAIETLDFADLPPLQRSRLVELDRAIKAFNAMVSGLRVFERYVPKRLVQEIVRDGHAQVRPDQRDITIMFTDIVGFSNLAEAWRSEETFAFLNAHFSLMSAAIDITGGTIDKYLGDGLLAFWGAPGRQTDHADRAIQTALAIRQEMAAENERRRARCEPIIKIRIGIHTGVAMVGEVGSEARLNFTAVGDAVNLASRVEAAGKSIGNDDVMILATEDTIALAEGKFETVALGETSLAGRAHSVRLFRL